ncbi:MAG: class I SAM-dependent methyltransferase [Candidatus Acidiferrales bacterium]
MNRLHQWYCRSNPWRRKLEDEILPWSLAGIDLGDEILEIGPGPGLTTDWLRHRYRAIMCLEVDPRLARSLGKRTAGTNVTVQLGDATAMPFRDRTFSAVVSFTMLHHVPSNFLQDRLFAEAYRVLKPGGVFAGTDSVRSLRMRVFHFGDTMVLVDPAKLPGRLESANFKDVKIQAGAGRFRFGAQRPLSAPPYNRLTEQTVEPR